jgi:hypothetical protein
VKRTAHLTFHIESCGLGIERMSAVMITDDPFEPTRLVVEPSCAPYFDIESLVFEARVLAIRGPIAATYFPPLPAPCTDHHDCQLDWEMGRRCKRVTDEAWAGWRAIAEASKMKGFVLRTRSSAYIIVRNTSAEARPFDAVLWGLAVVGWHKDPTKP